MSVGKFRNVALLQPSLSVDRADAEQRVKHEIRMRYKDTSRFVVWPECTSTRNVLDNQSMSASVLNVRGHNNANVGAETATTTRLDQSVDLNQSTPSNAHPPATIDSNNPRLSQSNPTDCDPPMPRYSPESAPTPPAVYITRL